MGLAPELSFEFGKSAKFTRHKIKVDKAAIERQVTDLQRRHGKMTDPDKSEANDMLVGAFAQLDNDGNVLEGGIASDSTISVEFVEDKKAKKALVGLEPGVDGGRRPTQSQPRPRRFGPHVGHQPRASPRPPRETSDSP